MFERTSVGLGVHARTVVACALDAQTGEIIPHRMTPDHGEILSWILCLPSPGRVVYEAGPTGFGLARFLLASGIDTVVAAPSKLQRPSGDRVKTDAKDALHLARLLKLGEVSGVRIPSAGQEAARDLVRSREDGDCPRLWCDSTEFRERGLVADPTVLSPTVTRNCPGISVPTPWS